jgi:DHA1 family 2-module integral membrane pump EmrD-like MFS transporter
MLLIGMMVFLVGTLTIQLIPSFMALLAGSFIQGLGTGAGGAMSRTVMRDRYSGAELNRANSLVSMGVIFSCWRLCWAAGSPSCSTGVPATGSCSVSVP